MRNTSLPISYSFFSICLRGFFFHLEQTESEGQKLAPACSKPNSTIRSSGEICLVLRLCTSRDPKSPAHFHLPALSIVNDPQLSGHMWQSCTVIQSHQTSHKFFRRNNSHNHTWSAGGQSSWSIMSTTSTFFSFILSENMELLAPQMLVLSLYA